MKAPSANDRVVAVMAYLTDAEFGYDHWKATQFLSPDGAVHAVLLIVPDKAAQTAVMARLMAFQEEG